MGLVPINRDEPEYTYYGFNGEVSLLETGSTSISGGDVYGMSDMRGDWQDPWSVDSAILKTGVRTGGRPALRSNFQPFLQARYVVTDKFSALTGGRIDYEHLYGPAMRQPIVDTTHNPADTTYGQDKSGWK